MHELSRFFGIIIAMNYTDPSPLHFHANHGRGACSMRGHF
jgi:hypothetical protein